MFKKRNRLKASSDIDALFRDSHSLKSRHLLIKIRKNQDLGLNRVMVTMAKALKISGVERNKVRRQLLHATKATLVEIPDFLGWDIGVILLAIPSGNLYQIAQTEINSLIREWHGKK